MATLLERVESARKALVAATDILEATAKDDLTPAQKTALCKAYSATVKALHLTVDAMHPVAAEGRA